MKYLANGSMIAMETANVGQMAGYYFDAVKICSENLAIAGGVLALLGCVARNLAVASELDDAFGIFGHFLKLIKESVREPRVMTEWRHRFAEPYGAICISRGDRNSPFTA